MKNPERRWYEFDPSTRDLVRKRCGDKCVVTGNKRRNEVHHLLTIHDAINMGAEPYLVKGPNNGVLVSREVHDQIHLEIQAWDDDYRELYMWAVYAYLMEADLLPESLKEINASHESEDLSYRVLYSA